MGIPGAARAARSRCPGPTVPVAGLRYGEGEMFPSVPASAPTPDAENALWAVVGNTTPAWVIPLYT